MSGTGKAIDMEKALLDPSSVFASPEEVAERNDLSVEQRIEILRRWSYDAAEDAVALEEGMPDGNSDLQHRVLTVLDRLTGGLDVEMVASGKHHGLRREATEKK
ncbi:hypothetical protein [Roseibium sp.]|uniref:hypothetical protein n=1 Tax=Roseibium sp. TaxID=1936156 RepID=UPI003262D00E